MSEDKPFSLPWIPQKWLGDYHVQSMTLEEQGAHMRLLCLSWESTTPGLIPKDERLLAQMVGVHGNKFRKLSRSILKAWKDGGDHWVNTRMVKQAKYVAHLRKVRQGAVNVRWKKYRIQMDIQNAYKTHTSKSSSSLSSSYSAPPEETVHIHNLEESEDPTTETPTGAVVPFRAVPKPGKREPHRTKDPSPLPEGFRFTRGVRNHGLRFGLTDDEIDADERRFILWSLKENIETHNWDAWAMLWIEREVKRRKEGRSKGSVDAGFDAFAKGQGG